MGWYATAQAIKMGKGPYGTVRESLNGEIDPARTLRTALLKIDQEIEDGSFVPDKACKIRMAFWRKRNI